MTGSRIAQGMIAVALLFVAGLAAAFGGFVWADSGSFVFALFGIPLACAGLALAAERLIRTIVAPVVVAGLGVVSLGWSLITAGSFGLGFALASLLMMGAASPSLSHRRGRRSVPSRS